jgi:hypothetical protein
VKSWLKNNEKSLTSSAVDAILYVMLKKRRLAWSRENVTLPDERYRAVKNAQQFLARLAGGEYPRVPKAVRAEARSILRHYPLSWDLDRAAEAAPDVFQERMEPLYRMVAAYNPETTQPQDPNNN